MANQDIKMRVKYSAEFDTSKISEGLKDIKKQVTNANISDELKKQFEDAFNKLQVNIPALEKLTSKEEFNLKDIEALQKLLREVTKDWENLNKVTDQIDLSKTFSTKDLEKINDLDRQIKQTQDNIQKARKELVDAFTKDATIDTSSKNVSDALTELFTVNPSEIDSKFKEIQEQFTQGIQQTQVELKDKLEHANIQKTGESIINYFFGKESGVEFAAKIGPVKDQINEIIKAYRGFKQVNDEAGMAEQIQKLNQVLTDTANFKFPEGYKLFGLPTQEDLNTLNSIGAKLGELKALAQTKEGFFTEEEAKVLDLIKQKIEAETKATLDAKNANEQLHNSSQVVGNGFQDIGKKAENLNTDLNKMNAQSAALEKTFGGLARRIENSVSALTIFNKGTQIVRNAINSVKELDAAFTQIAIVSEQTNEQAWSMFDSFNKLAKQYSITTKDLTEGAKLFYQQGLNAADTMKMVEASTVSAALGEVTMTEAANTLTAAIQGYNESAAVAMDYTDKIAMVGAVSAADFNELSTAMEKTASSAYTAGIDFDHLLGYLGKMIEVTREAPANLGTAMKTIIARFEDMKKDPTALIDGASANKVEAALATIGIALRDTAGEFRPLQNVIDELGMKWESLTRNQQAYIATVAAGSRQQSRFLAMMNNYDRTLDLITESQNSAGAAAEQYAIYQDSAAAAANRLSAAWEEFYSKIVNSEQIIGVINSLEKLVEVMSKIGPVWTSAMATFGAFTINKVIKGGGLFSKVINYLGQEITTSKGENLTVTVANVFRNGVDLGIKRGLGKFKDFSEYENALKKAGQLGVEKGITSGLGNVGTKIGGIIAPLIANLGSILTGAVIAAIIAAISIGVAKAAIYAEEKEQRWLKKESEQVKKDREKVENYKKEKRAIEDNYKIYEKYNKQIILSEEELEENNNAIEAIRQQYENLIVVTDELGRKNILNSKELENHTKELENQTLELEKQNALKKYEATNPSNAQKRRYGNSDEYMKDWTTTQLMNVGYTEEEAQILDSYGDLFRNKDDRKRGAFITPTNISLYDKITAQNKIVDDNLDRYIETILSKNSEKVSKLLDELRIRESEVPEGLKELKEYYKTVEQYAQLALDGIEILNNRSSEYAKTLLNLNLKNIDSSFLQSDLSNLFNNLNNFNNGAFLEQFNENNLKPGQTIEQLVEEINNSIEEYINNLNPADQRSFHELTEKLLDPSLSPNKKRELVEKFRVDAEGISDEVDKILDQYVEGSNFDIKRREKLSNSLGIDSQFLRQFNSNQLRIIDQFRTANKNTKGENAFDLGAYIQTDAGAQMLKLLSSLENDITKDPTIYRRAQDVMINFFKTNFKLNDKEAFDTFQEIFGNFPELAMEAAESKFSNAKNLILTEPTKALSKKQSEAYLELESILGDSLRNYIAINEQGEEYLTVVGKIAVFEKTAQDYRNTLIAEGDNYISQMKQIFAISEKNEKGEYLLTKEQKKQISNLEQEIELNSKKLEQLDKIKEYTTQVTAETANISMANNYSDNLKVFKQAEDEIKKFNGVMNNDTAASIMAMNASYAKYLEKKLVGDQYYYTVSEQGLASLREEEKKNYNLWIEEQRNKLQERIDELEAELKYFSEIASTEYEINEDFNEDDFNNKIGLLDNKLDAAETELEGEIQYEDDKNKEILIGASNTAQQFQNMWSAAYTNLRGEWNELARAMQNGEPTESVDYSPSLQIPQWSPTGMNTNINSAKKPSENNSNNSKEGESREQRIKRRAQEQVDRLNEVIGRLKAARDNLVPLGPELEDVSKSGSKASDEMKKLTKVLEGLTDALEDLDKLLIDVKKDLNDIDIDYNPFTDLFEAWEHEWDYYYNIKRLISQIQTQGEYIDNIISADYTSANQKVQAYHAKAGNLIAAMSANDAYITALRTGMAQTGVELMKDYGEYYKIDSDTMQIYQHDTSLQEINDTINTKREELYELQKTQNEQENNLNLQNAKLEALEKQKSAYEDILSTIDSQIDSLENDEDIVADISGLLSEKESIKANIEITDSSIDAQKDVIKNLEEEIQNVEIKITLKEQEANKLEDYVDKMEDKVSEYEEYWENLNSTIAEQQELLQQLQEIHDTYVDIAISTEQELYDAIVENYQNEIDQKKEQYDYLKQLDNDYLNTIKNNISKERQAREDANKQKSYQQNLQRAQLLQMDTSGAYRSELANLNKEIESQRQDLYDDLVDKQVEALETEIEKRHELYDMEVAALEERLAYMQENAILLWEMVNQIVADGSEAMMATLENTIEYINSNELAKQKQRIAWENSIKMTIDGVTENHIDTLNQIISAGAKYIESIKEIDTAVNDNINTYGDSTILLAEKNEEFQTAMDKYMSEWNRITNGFTGYYESWSANVKNLKTALTDNINALIAMNNEGGSIKELEEKLSESAGKMYQAFLDEREKYADDLAKMIKNIQDKISAAITSAAKAITGAANSIKVNNSNNSGTTGPTTGGGGTNPTTGGTSPGSGGGYKGWTAWFNLKNYYGDGRDYVYQDRTNLTNASYDKLYQSWEKTLEDMRKKYPGTTSWGFTVFKQGGLADFTGPAWLDGTKSEPERILSPRQTKLFESMVSSLEQASNNSNINSPLGSSYNIGDINTSIQVAKLDNNTDIEKLAKKIEDKIVKTVRNRVVVSI